MHTGNEGVWEIITIVEVDICQTETCCQMEKRKRCVAKLAHLRISQSCKVVNESLTLSLEEQANMS